MKVRFVELKLPLYNALQEEEVQQLDLALTDHVLTLQPRQVLAQSLKVVLLLFKHEAHVLLVIEVSIREVNLCVNREVKFALQGRFQSLRVNVLVRWNLCDKELLHIRLLRELKSEFLVLLLL